MTEELPTPDDADADDTEGNRRRYGRIEPAAADTADDTEGNRRHYHLDPAGADDTGGHVFRPETDDEGMTS